MIFDYSLAALVTVGLMIYLTYALLARATLRGTTATFIGWLQIILLRDHVAIVPFRQLHGASSMASARSFRPFLDPSKRCFIRQAEWMRSANSTG